MNSIILMAEIVEDPQLRYTSDSQLALTEMLVQFPALRDVDPPSTLRVIAWGNFAQEVHEKYHQGDQIIIEGRLGMNLIERKEGFKEKRAELTAQRIYPVQMPFKTQSQHSDPTATNPNKVVPLGSRRASTPTSVSEDSLESRRPPANPSPSRVTPPSEPENPDYDPIPFKRAVAFSSVEAGLVEGWELEINRPRVGFEWTKF
ncbi:Thylakoid-associated single-stranded DNA-binding protein slr1034 [Planktothrix tepida]|uniref:Single-strand binding protein/Primosomal replication protein n n=2 Tax=Planktothrix TaxID=54304 RepID=A0A1J1LR91_9CYAN|nr:MULTISPECIES: single-stranded DNA-binding protein [Planktothrix]CAD5936021.1 Thylakoid-associated single-stranded DNA-binding protein slr1034 [Planktothrix pseudagardhii]CAD5974210.1 Thylakoid-associated single-stranded DNA-binding protein slr1034 [Planktothrix tepida]CUR34364.1 Single-strand binding protein/Primosomal replication protein n [Planktothrix tepida PCC 9214]